MKAATYLLLICGLSAGCRHKPVPVDMGASSFAVVEAGRAGANGDVIVGDVGEPKPATFDKDYRPAAPLKGQPLPVYPARALKAKAGAATVGIRVQVDARGKVTDIGPSLLVFNTPGPHAEDFLEAVKTAVSHWRFRPAEILQLERVSAQDVNYDRVTRREAVDSQIDLAFTFTATGGVMAGK